MEINEFKEFKEGDIFIGDITFNCEIEIERNTFSINECEGDVKLYGFIEGDNMSQIDHDGDPDDETITENWKTENDESSLHSEIGTSTTTRDQGEQTDPDNHSVKGEQPTPNKSTQTTTGQSTQTAQIQELEAILEHTPIVEGYGDFEENLKKAEVYYSILKQMISDLEQTINNNNTPTVINNNNNNNTSDNPTKLNEKIEELKKLIDQLPDKQSAGLQRNYDELNTKLSQINEGYDRINELLAPKTNNSGNSNSNSTDGESSDGTRIATLEEQIMGMTEKHKNLTTTIENLSEYEKNLSNKLIALKALFEEFQKQKNTDTELMQQNTTKLSDELKKVKEQVVLAQKTAGDAKQATVNVQQAAVEAQQAVTEVIASAKEGERLANEAKQDTQKIQQIIEAAEAAQRKAVTDQQQQPEAKEDDDETNSSTDSYGNGSCSDDDKKPPHQDDDDSNESKQDVNPEDIDSIKNKSVERIIESIQKFIAASNKSIGVLLNDNKFKKLSEKSKIMNTNINFNNTLNNEELKNNITTLLNNFKLIVNRTFEYKECTMEPDIDSYAEPIFKNNLNVESILLNLNSLNDENLKDLVIPNIENQTKDNFNVKAFTPKTDADKTHLNNSNKIITDQKNNLLENSYLTLNIQDLKVHLNNNENVYKEIEKYSKVYEPNIKINPKILIKVFDYIIKKNDNIERDIFYVLNNTMKCLELYKNLYAILFPEDEKKKEKREVRNEFLGHILKEKLKLQNKDNISVFLKLNDRYWNNTDEYAYNNKNNAEFLGGFNEYNRRFDVRPRGNDLVLGYMNTYNYENNDADMIKILEKPLYIADSTEDESVKQYKLDKKLFKTNEATRKIFSGENRMRKYYGFGSFNEIFYPHQKNDEIVEQESIKELIKKIEKENVFIVGYGTSGSGKTSSLIHLNKGTDEKKKEGIIVKLCNKIGNHDIKVTILEQFHESAKSLLNPKVLDKLRESDNNNFSLLKKCDGVSFNKTDNDPYILSDNHKYSNFFPSRQEITGEFNGNNATLSKFLEVYVDKDRLVKATPNNPQSSRSHVVVIIEFVGTNKGKLIVGDFAGIENKFDETNMTTLCQFANIKTDKGLFYNLKKIKYHSGILDDGFTIPKSTADSVLQGGGFGDSTSDRFPKTSRSTITNGNRQPGKSAKTIQQQKRQPASRQPASQPANSNSTKRTTSSQQQVSTQLKPSAQQKSEDEKIILKIDNVKFLYNTPGKFYLCGDDFSEFYNKNQKGKIDTDEVLIIKEKKRINKNNRNKEAGNIENIEKPEFCYTDKLIEFYSKDEIKLLYNKNKKEIFLPDHCSIPTNTYTIEYNVKVVINKKGETIKELIKDNTGEQIKLIFLENFQGKKDSYLLDIKVDEGKIEQKELIQQNNLINLLIFVKSINDIFTENDRFKPNKKPNYNSGGYAENMSDNVDFKFMIIHLYDYVYTKIPTILENIKNIEDIEDIEDTQEEVKVKINQENLISTLITTYINDIVGTPKQGDTPEKKQQDTSRITQFAKCVKLLKTCAGVYLFKMLTMQKIVLQRKKEGEYINNSLYELEDSIREYLRGKNGKIFRTNPNIFEDCKKCIPNTFLYPIDFEESGKTSQQNKFKGSNLLYQFDDENTKIQKEQEEKMHLVLFGFLNIARNANNPPPVEYLDITNFIKNFKKIKNDSEITDINAVVPGFTEIYNKYDSIYPVNDVKKANSVSNFGDPIKLISKVEKHNASTSIGTLFFLHRMISFFTINDYPCEVDPPCLKNCPTLITENKNLKKLEMYESKERGGYYTLNDILCLFNSFKNNISYLPSLENKIYQNFQIHSTDTNFASGGGSRIPIKTRKFKKMYNKIYKKTVKKLKSKSLIKFYK